MRVQIKTVKLIKMCGGKKSYKKKSELLLHGYLRVYIYWFQKCTNLISVFYSVVRAAGNNAVNGPNAGQLFQVL